MVDDFLDVERLENGVISLYRMPTNVENLLLRCVDYWRPHAEAYHLNLHYTCGGNVPSIPVDQRLMRRVLLNLLKNCVRYTPENGRILVQTAVTPEGVTITIADSGTIVPVCQREMVFAKNARLDGGTNRDIGLGLPFSKLVTEAHGGHLLLEESPLGGMQFVLSLPFSLAANGVRQQQDGLTAVYTGRVVT
jgi:signal transduction histidine kinase